MQNPPYRLLLKYNIDDTRQEYYYRYVIEEFVPLMQSMGLMMLFAWHVYSHHHPERQIEFVCDSSATLRTVLESESFKRAEDRLKTYTTTYSRKIVRFHNRFQF